MVFVVPGTPTSVSQTSRDSKESSPAIPTTPTASTPPPLPTPQTVPAQITSTAGAVKTEENNKSQVKPSTPPPAAVQDKIPPPPAVVQKQISPPPPPSQKSSPPLARVDIKAAVVAAGATSEVAAEGDRKKADSADGEKKVCCAVFICICFEMRMIFKNLFETLVFLKN